MFWQGAAGSERMHEADRGPGAGERKHGVAEEDGGVGGWVVEQQMVAQSIDVELEGVAHAKNSGHCWHTV